MRSAVNIINYLMTLQKIKKGASVEKRIPYDSVENNSNGDTRGKKIFITTSYR